VKKRIPAKRRNTSLRWIRFQRAVSPHSEAAPTYALGALTPLQIAMRPISQTRGQADANTK